MEFFDVLDSTNNVVKRAIDQGEPQGYAVAAKVQTAGYGRQGRTWSSPQGGLYLSVLLRPAVSLEAIPSLALVTALAVRASLQEQFSRIPANAVLIKWPNDLVICASEPSAPDADALQANANAPFRKLCGISCELHGTGVCVGVGVNVARAADVRTDGRYQAAFLDEIAPELRECAVAPSNLLPQLAQHIAERIVQYARRWEREGFAAFVAEYNDASYLQGRMVRLATEEGVAQAEGTACGVNAAGELLLCLPSGEMKRICAGEAHVC